VASPRTLDAVDWSPFSLNRVVLVVPNFAEPRSQKRDLGRPAGSDEAGFQPFVTLCGHRTRPVGPGWDDGAPLALLVRAGRELGWV